MYHSKFQRACMALYYGWGHAGELSQKNKTHNRLWYYSDILYYFFKYGLGSQRYVQYHFELKTKEQKQKSAAMFYEKVFAGRLLMRKTRIFIAKWSSIKYHTTPQMIHKRNMAYKKFYNMGESPYIEYGVTIYNYHHHLGKFTTGDNVVLARNCDLDITGDLTLGNKVSISDGAKLITHAHDLEYKFKGEAFNIDDLDTTKGCIQTPLTIGDSAWIGTRAIIMPGVTEIGRFAVVAADAVVEKRVPPYAIVKGNPAKIVGFRCTPEAAIQFEEANYPPEQRIPYEELKANYEKYFNSERRKQIRQWMRY